MLLNESSSSPTIETFQMCSFSKRERKQMPDVWKIEITIITENELNIKHQTLLSNLFTTVVIKRFSVHKSCDGTFQFMQELSHLPNLDGLGRPQCIYWVMTVFCNFFYFHLAIYDKMQICFVNI